MFDFITFQQAKREELSFSHYWLLCYQQLSCTYPWLLALWTALLPLLLPLLLSYEEFYTLDQGSWPINHYITTRVRKSTEGSRVKICIGYLTFVHGRTNIRRSDPALITYYRNWKTCNYWRRGVSWRWNCVAQNLRGFNLLLL